MLAIARHSFLVFTLLFSQTLLAEPLYSEIYSLFDQGDSLEKIRREHPNATFEDINEAWVKSNQTVVKMSGDGISGDFYLVFNYVEHPTVGTLSIYSGQSAGGNSQQPSEMTETRFLNPLEKKLILSWVRWSSPTPIPMEVFESRYGKPGKCDVHDETLQPYCAWDSLGVFANLDTKKKMVLSSEYSYNTLGWRRHGAAGHKAPAKSHMAAPRAQTSKLAPKEARNANTTGKTTSQPTATGAQATKPNLPAAKPVN